MGIAFSQDRRGNGLLHGKKKTYNDEHPAVVAASEMQPTIHGLGEVGEVLLVLGAAGDWAVTTTAAVKMAIKS